MNSPTNSPASGKQPQAPGHPIPKPGPKPRPRPGAQAAPRRTTSNHADFGRVEDDGTAWVLNPDGSKRHIGEFKAGSPQEGFHHFTARYDDLATEVTMLVARLRNHPEEARTIRTDALQLKEGLLSATVIGDLAQLDTQLTALANDCTLAEEQALKNKAAQREQAIARKEALAAEAEKIGEEATDWKAAGDRLRAILEEWKTIRGIDRSTDDALWRRYSAGRDTFSRRRGAHFSELDRNRAEAKKKKEELVAQAEALQSSTEWATTAGEFKNLMSQWKAAGRATREAEDRLWERFKHAQDAFFDARKADAAKKDEEFEGNAQAKQALLDEYDAKINPEQGLDKARALLHELQDKWEKVGYVPRSRIREFEEKIALVERRVSQAAEAEWRRTDPETLARVAQFQAKVDQLTADAAAAEAKGNKKKAASLQEQAAQWREWAAAAASAAQG